MEGGGRALTGRDAAEAVGALMRLGGASARFDARRVLSAIRTREGRARVLSSMRRPLEALGGRVRSTCRPAAPRPRSAARVRLAPARRSPAIPARPAPPGAE